MKQFHFDLDHFNTIANGNGQPDIYALDFDLRQDTFWARVQTGVKWVPNGSIMGSILF